MGRYGATALTIVGYAVGSYFGYPQLGAVVGNLVGSALFPTDLGTVSGPRLNDLNVQTSTVGAPIPILYGDYAFSGNVIWTSGVIETVKKKRQGGKGGPTQTVKTYTYKVNCAVGICEGVIDGVLRIWADSVLVYDVRPQLADETLAEYTERLTMSGKFADFFEVYDGSETQMPDPTIETFEGVGNVSAFRGLAYVVFNEFQLGDYGNRIPNFRFEARRCFAPNDNLITYKQATEVRSAADGRSIDSELVVGTEANKLYWMVGVLRSAQTNPSGLPRIAVAFEHGGDSEGWLSKDGIWQSYQPEGTSISWQQSPRELSQLGSSYATSSGGVLSTTNIATYYLDSVLWTGNSGGNFGFKWGLADLGAAGSSSVNAGSWICKRELKIERGWGGVVKPATTSRSTFSVAADPDLAFDLIGTVVGTRVDYLVRGTLWLRAPATPDIRVGFGLSAGSGVVANVAGFIITQSPMKANSDVEYSASDFEAGVFTANNTGTNSTRVIAGTGDDTTYVDYRTHYEFVAMVSAWVIDNNDPVLANFNVIWGQANDYAPAPAQVLAGSSLVYRNLTEAAADDVEYVVKSSDEARYSVSSTLEDDAELVVTLRAGRTYFLEGVVVCYNDYDYNHETRMAFDFTGTADASELFLTKTFCISTGTFFDSRPSDFTHNTPSSLGSEFAVNGLGNNSSYRGGVRLRGTIRVQTTGVFKLKWRKSTNGYGGSKPSIVFAGSFLTAQDLEMDLSVGDCALTLGDIVADVSGRCGIPAAQTDVTDLTEVVDGYVVTRTMPGRSAIEPLRTFGWFDCVESDGILKWPLRGKPSVATLTEDDLGAREESETAQPMVSTARAQTVELPRRLRVHFAQVNKNYEMGEQSASRISVGSEQVQDIEVAIAMDDDKAAQIADVVLYDLWVGRNTHSFALDHGHLPLEPSDAVTLPIDGRQERVRITAKDHSLPGLLKLEAVRDDDGVYTSYAVGAPNAAPGGGGGTIATPGVAQMLLLDLPLLTDSDNDAGYYVAVNAVGATLFSGARVYRSPDGGITYEDVALVTDQAVTGSVVTALPVGPTTVIDEGSVLIVALNDEDDSLESIVNASLLAGLNAAAIGSHGRWEIVQFRDAELVGDVWHLSGLLRGRRGTEWVMGSGQDADIFVLLDASLVRVASTTSFIGTSRPHKVVLSGDLLESAVPQDFTCTAVALAPFSPVDASGSRDLSGDLTITWKRRGRIGQEFPSGADIALSEETEAYEVDVVDTTSSPEVVVRTISTSTQSAIYTEAEQVADFGSPVPTEITVRIYQLSGIVGRGYPLEAIV